MCRIEGGNGSRLTSDIPNQPRCNATGIFTVFVIAQCTQIVLFGPAVNLTSGMYPRLNPRSNPPAPRRSISAITSFMFACSRQSAPLFRAVHLYISISQMSNHGCAWFTPGNVKIDKPSPQQFPLRVRDYIHQVKNLITLKKIPRRPSAPEFHLIAPHYGVRSSAVIWPAPDVFARKPRPPSRLQVFWRRRWSKNLHEVDESECSWGSVVFTGRRASRC